MALDKKTLADIGEKLKERHIKAQQDGGSIYDDGDPTGAREITLTLSDGRRFLLSGVVVKDISRRETQEEEDIPSWELTLRWDSLVLLT